MANKPIKPAGPPARADYDPGPLPTDALRIFAPSAAHDIRTGKGYLEACFIRLQSVVSRDEKFTVFEQQAIASAIRDATTTLVQIRDIIIENALFEGRPLLEHMTCPALAPDAQNTGLSRDRCVLAAMPWHEWHQAQDGMRWRWINSTTCKVEGDD